MYNVKVFEYPSGWHVRVYSRSVGFCEERFRPKEIPMVTDAAWNPEIEDWETVRYNPKTACIEPFTNQLARKLPADRQRDSERSAASSMARTKNKVYYLSRSNLWDWFVTLTFDPEKVDSFDYDACVNCLKNWLDTCRRLCPDLKYIMVPEKHKSGRFHFHGLFANCEDLDFVDSGHKDSSGEIVYNIGRYRSGWSTATQVKDNSRVTQYISKYITKDLCSVSFGKKRYWASRNLDEAPTQELNIDGSELPAYLSGLEELSNWNKTLDMPDITIHYFEMGVNGNE